MMSTIPFPSVWHIFAKPYQNITRIFPTQQSDVGRMIDVCRNDPNIRKIIIFGSSVTPLCNPWSDIDIYFEMKEPPQRYPSIGSHTAVFDKWDNFSVDENLKREIDEKGVVVYERDRRKTIEKETIT